MAAGSEQQAFAIVGAVVATPTLIWASGATILAGIKATALLLSPLGGKLRSLPGKIPSLNRWRREYIRASLYKARHR